MAYVNKRHDASTYIACFRDKGGNLIRKSTGEKDRAKAQLMADTWEQLTRGDIGHRRLMEVANILRGVNMVTVREHCKKWLASRHEDWKPSTRSFYAATAKSFMEGIGPAADKAIGQISKQDVVAWRDALTLRISKKTANQYLKGLRSILKGAIEDELMETNPAELVTTLKIRGETPRNAFTVEQVRKLLAVAEGEWKGLILLGLYTGLRLGDVAALTWADVDLKGGFIAVNTAKTETAVRIALPPALAGYLAGLKHRAGPLHPGALAAMEKADGRTVTLSGQFAQLLIKAGLREGGTSHSKVAIANGRGGKRAKNALVFHSLRHTLVSMMKEANVPQSVVMAIAGHKSEAVSQRYTHTSDAALREAAAAMPDVTG